MNSDPDASEVRQAVDEVRRNSLWATRLEVTLVFLSGLAVAISSVSAVYIGLNAQHQRNRIEDCTQPQGLCYQQNQKATAKAVQAILDYVRDSFLPHRLRNEAENQCQVELFARKPTVLNSGAEQALNEYDACVLRRSGNIPPPEPPPNPLTTTTTMTVKEGK